MKAISVRQPWCSLLAEGTKTTECRSWATRHRGDLLLCAGARVDRDAPAALAERGLSLPVGRAPLGQAIAVVQVVDCHRDADCCRPWGIAGGWHWTIADPYPLAEPFGVKGQLGFFDVELPDGS